MRAAFRRAPRLGMMEALEEKSLQKAWGSSNAESGKWTTPGVHGQHERGPVACKGSRWQGPGGTRLFGSGSVVPCRPRRHCKFSQGRDLPEIQVSVTRERSTGRPRPGPPPGCRPDEP